MIWKIQMEKYNF